MLKASGCTSSGSSRPSRSKKIAVEHDQEYYKDEALRLLVAPIEALAALFQEAFRATGFPTDLINVDWAKGTITIEFGLRLRSPTSDDIRDTIFKLYESEWGGKPGGMEVAYNRAIEYRGVNDFVYASQRHPDSQPIRLFITSDQKFLSALARCQDFFVLDCKEFKDWKASKVHKLHKRANAKPVRLWTATNAFFNEVPWPMLGREDVDPGEQVPVVTIGLFRV